MSGPFTVGRFLRPYRAKLGLVLGILGLNVALGIANPWLVGQLVDRVLIARRADLLWVFAAVFAGVAAFRFATGLVQGQLYTALSSRVLLDMRRDFLERLQKLSLRFFAGARFGDLVVRFNRDLAQVQEFATGALPGLLTSAVTLLGVLSCGLLYDWKLFLLAATPFPAALLLARAFRVRVRDLTAKLREASSDLAGVVTEALLGARTVRSFGRERRELRRFVGTGHRLVRAGLGMQWTSSLASGLPRLCLVASTVLVYWVGGLRVVRGEMGLGSLIALSMYAGMMFGPLMSLVDFYLQLVQTRVSLERVRALRELEPEVVEDESAPLPGPVRGAISFEDVRFRHREEDPLLEGVSFEVAPGETVALVGPSGSGKSTIVDLLFRFIDPQRGRVLVDGRDLRGIRASALRRAMAVVSQDVFLFHDTVLENIRYGRPGATREEALGAARLSGADAMLSGDGAGLETVVGERGLRLSAGQRQRVAIARALLRRPRILVLDEATSSLDYASDRAIREGVARLMEGATTLIVTHRVDQLPRSARVLRLAGGRVVEEDRAAAPAIAARE